MLSAYASEAPTVAQLNAERIDNPQGLLHFLLQIPTSHEAAIFYAGLLAMLAGFFASWITKYAVAKVIDDTLVDYFFRVHKRRTLGVFASYVGTLLFAISTGLFDNAGAFTGWYNVLGWAFTAAMAADGTLNKGTQGEWSPAQRAAERSKQAEAAAK